MAIYSIDAVTPLYDGYTQGLQDKIVNAVMNNDKWQYAFIENIIMEVNKDSSQLQVSFHLSTYYDYSLTKTLADQAEEADHYHQELAMILDRMNIYLEDSCASISFEYENDFFYTFPRTVTVSDAIFRCEEGKELMNNTFMCVNCSVGFHSAIVNNIPTCVECEQGTYNGQVGRGQCTFCPEHMSTLENETGLTTDEHCQNVCPPNEYSLNGITDCVDCPNDTYQPNYGSTYCINCSLNDTLNEAVAKCYVPSSEVTIEPSVTMTPTSAERSPEIHPMVYIAVAIVLTIAIVTVLVILIIVVIVRRYKWKNRLRTNREGNKPSLEFELHGFNERRTENPLYSMEHDNDVVYDRVRVNPMAILENENRQFPLTKEHMEQRGERIRQARRKFETRPTSLPPASGSLKNDTTDGDEDSIIDELPVDAYEESDIDSEDCEERVFKAHSMTKSQSSEEEDSSPVQTTPHYDNTAADKYHRYEMVKPAKH